MTTWRLTVLLLTVLTIHAAYSSPKLHPHLSHTWGQRVDHKICYATTDNPYLKFASKTAYNTIYYPNDINTIPSECSPRQVWMLVRHGARYPLRKKMEKFHELEKIRDHIVHNKKHRGSLCNMDIDNLKAWKMDNIPLEESDHLAEQGYRDLHQIGERTRRRFYGDYNSSNQQGEHNFKFQYTNHEKTKFSAEAFADGFFGRKISIPKPTSNDLLTKIYPDCKVKPLPNVEDPPDKGSKERSLFRDGPVIQEAIANISTRLGFVHPLTIDQVENMYDMCRYKKSWSFEELSPWCACFEKSELKALEYVADLSYYYNSGHGYSANLRTGCPLVQDLLQRFRNIANGGTDEPQGVYYFGHSTTIYNLISRLEIIKDPVHITHSNYYSMSKRKWRTSLIAPFSGNFAAVMLACNEGEKNRVVFYHNERPFKFPNCNGYVCSWQAFEEMYKNVTDPSTCNFDFCEENETTTESGNTSNQLTHNSLGGNNNYTVDDSLNNLESVLVTTERSNAINQDVPFESRKVVQQNRADFTIKRDMPNEPAALIRQPENPPGQSDHTFKGVNTAKFYFPIYQWILLGTAFTTLIFIAMFTIRWKSNRNHANSMTTGYQNMNALLLKDFNA